MNALSTSAKELIPIQIVVNRKPEKNGELIGVIQGGGKDFLGKIAFFEGDNQLQEGDFAFVDGAIASEFKTKKFAKVNLIGGRSYGHKLDDARAAAYAALTARPPAPEPAALNEDEAYHLALFEQATHSDQSIESWTSEALTIDDAIELPHGLEIVHLVNDPEAPNREFRLIRGTRANALAATRDWASHGAYKILGVAGDEAETIVALAKR